MGAWLLLIWHFGEAQAVPLTGLNPAGLPRKAIHVLVYGVLGGLLALALGPARRTGWVVAACLLVGLADELHQGFVPRRSFTLWDLALDVAAGALGAVAGGGVWGSGPRAPACGAPGPEGTGRASPTPPWRAPGARESGEARAPR